MKEGGGRGSNDGPSPASRREGKTLFVDVVFTPGELVAVDWSLFGAAAVVDVLRFTTTALTALEHGAAGVVPVATPEEALAWRRQGAVLGGERGAVRIPGFDLGNSPFDYKPEAVAGKLVVMTTTNGTQAFSRLARAASEGGENPGGLAVFAACLRNAAAAARALAQEAQHRGKGALIVCSGTDGRFSREDAYCAALIVERLQALAAVEPGDGAVAALRLKAGAGDGSQAALSELTASFHGRRLLRLGLRDDVAFCAQVDASGAVPVLRDGRLVLAGTRPERGE